ncbi:Hypothetical predicted protein [Mytilus galloprovincialis]|uniref:SRCR domain-containing protein n=1 Tax=Mytilus galloprovincialis TaxID=29158 RepID=A0A8B6DLP6_MYTGA|nr:Hypothetical predicted protein [Mytilus galloprovincialis]
MISTSETNKGRLEIYHEGKWGTICNRGFDHVDAAVACRQLGYWSSWTVEYNNTSYSSWDSHGNRGETQTREETQSNNEGASIAIQSLTDAQTKNIIRGLALHVEMLGE